MGEGTKIQWTDHTFNIVWGCVEVSEECAKCYAREWAKRCGFDVWGKNKPRRTFGNDHWLEPMRWNEKARQSGVKKRVFCSSMADVFEDHPTVLEEQKKLWELIEKTEWLEWQLLTKRPENMAGMAPWKVWPMNIVAMTTTGTKKAADERIPHLLNVQAHRRALSAEPLLEEIRFKNLKRIRHRCVEAHCSFHYSPKDCPTCGGSGWMTSGGGIDQIIFGGESGPGARPCNVEWIRSGVKQCQAAGVKVFVKQIGSNPAPLIVEEGSVKERLWLKDKKGGDINEFPEDLRIREFPE